MFERFTDRARRVIVLAQEEARALQHNYIGTEHLLLGLIREGEGVAAKALASKGVTLDDTRKQVEEMTRQRQCQPPTGTAHPLYSARQAGVGAESARGAATRSQL